MSRKFFNVALLVVLAISVALAQQPASQSTPSTERLRTDITYLASDSLEGRRTGSPGANAAARYIAGEFKRSGLGTWMPGIRSAIARGETLERYLQPFPYVAGVELGKGNVLRFAPIAFPTTTTLNPPLDLRVDEEWMPLGFSSNGNINRASAVFVGYSITDSALKYDDYAGESAKGKVAIAFTGTPDGDNPHGKFARFEDVRFKAVAAREHGAVALTVIAREDTFREDLLTRLRYDNNGDAGLPVVVISRQAAVRLFGKGDLPGLSNFERIIRRAALAKVEPASTDPSEVALIAFTVSISLSVDVNRRESPSFNVIGILPGSDPKLKDETIVIGAHYDHLGHGGAGSLAPRSGEIHHGADDNASGTAALIELARMFSSQNPKPRRTIVFIAFSGEEEGLIGSSYYVNHPVVPLANTVAMINMDMIGRLKDNKLIVGGMGTATDWRPLVDQENSRATLNGGTLCAPNTNVVANTVTASAKIDGNGSVKCVNGSSPGKWFSLTLSEDGFGPSDHSSFYGKQVPVLFFWTGTHEDYHKPSDTADKINYEGEARIVGFVSNIIRDIDKNEKRPTYTVAKSESTGRSTGFRVYLGTIPNYADTNDGLKLDGVRDESPAAKAGLQAGDRIVKMAGKEVRNVYDYTYALGEMKAGQEYEVEIVRGSERLTLKITPAARK
jgi:aminopeptidase YwaD